MKKYYLAVGYYEVYITTTRRLNFMRGYNQFGEFDSIEDVLDYIEEEFPSATILYEREVAEELFFDGVEGHDNDVFDIDDMGCVKMINSEN